jgi:hypothetical protein
MTTEGGGQEKEGGRDAGEEMDEWPGVPVQRLPPCFAAVPNIDNNHTSIYVTWLCLTS